MASSVYKNLQEHPLKEVVIALGMATAGNTVQIETKIKELQEQVKTVSPMQLNEWIQGIFNKLWVSQLIQQNLFSHPIISMFVEEGRSYEAHRELFSTKLLNVTDYDQTVKISNDIVRPKQLRTVLSTVFKKKCDLTVELDYARAAFASPTAFASWKSSVFDSMNDTVSIFLYEYIADAVAKGIKNTIDLKSETKLEDLLQKINTLSDNMAFPSMAYNLGYQSNGTGIDRVHDPLKEEHLRKNWTKREDLILITTPEVKNALDAKVGAIKFHNQYFDISKYNVVTLDKDKLKETDETPFILLVDKKAFKGYFRINQVTSQFYANNMLTDFFNHFWLVFGEVPWVNGVKIQFNKDLLN